MKETILRLHEDLHQELNKLSNEGTASIDAEQGFRIASDYWQQVKNLVRQNRFSDEAAEIDFFKNIKPKFTSQLEYFLLLYRYQVYASGDPVDYATYRREEITRLEKFRETHAVFIRYFEENRSDWDDTYFLRRKLQKTHRPPSQVYDRAKELWTNGDWIITLLIANRLFEEYLERA